MSTARCYLDPIRKRPNLRIETGALTEACCSTASAARRALFASDGAVREARAAREVVVSAGIDQLPAAAGAVGHRPAGAPARARASRCATRCPASARTCATTTRRARAGRSAPRASPSTTRGRGLGLVRQALRYALSRQGHARHGGGADPRLRPLARGPRGAGPAAGLGADADRAGPEGPEDLPASPA